MGDFACDDVDPISLAPFCKPNLQIAQTQAEFDAANAAGAGAGTPLLNPPDCIPREQVFQYKFGNVVKCFDVVTLRQHFRATRTTKLPLPPYPKLSTNEFFKFLQVLEAWLRKEQLRKESELQFVKETEEAQKLFFDLQTKRIEALVPTMQAREKDVRMLKPLFLETNETLVKTLGKYLDTRMEYESTLQGALVQQYKDIGMLQVETRKRWYKVKDELQVIQREIVALEQEMLETNVALQLALVERNREQFRWRSISAEVFYFAYLWVLAYISNQEPQFSEFQFAIALFQLGHVAFEALNVGVDAETVVFAAIARVVGFLYASWASGNALQGGNTKDAQTIFLHGMKTFFTRAQLQ